TRSWRGLITVLRRAASRYRLHRSSPKDGAIHRAVHPTSSCRCRSNLPFLPRVSCRRLRSIPSYPKSCQTATVSWKPSNSCRAILPRVVNTTPGHAAIVSVVGRCGGVPCIEDQSMIPPIPPQAENWKIIGITPFQDDVTLYLAYPHGHLRLKDMTYVVTYPDG